MQELSTGGAGKCKPHTFTISVSASPSAGGTVSGGGTYSSGSMATVTATPNACYSFVNWTEGDTVVSTSASYTFTVTSDRTLVAHFALIQYTISASVSPSGGGTITGAGNYSCGSSVTLRATAANSCFRFVAWLEGTSVASTSATYTFTANSTRTLIADFHRSSECR